LLVHGATYLPTRADAGLYNDTRWQNVSIFSLRQNRRAHPARDPKTQKAKLAQCLTIMQAARFDLIIST
jgi:hypothetical protein